MQTEGAAFYIVLLRSTRKLCRTQVSMTPDECSILHILPGYQNGQRGSPTGIRNGSHGLPRGRLGVLD